MLPHTPVPRSPPACLAMPARLPGRAWSMWTCDVHTHICVTVLSACGLPRGAAAPLPASPADLRLLPPAQTRIIQGLALGGFAALLSPS